MQYPGFIARFYDVIYHHIRTGVDTAFYLQHIREANGPVLEAGTGTGRLFLDALATGADIYGIDISPSMLDVLKTRLTADQLSRVEVNDICTFSHRRKYKLVIAPFRVFSHLLTIDDQLQALNNTWENLAEGGRFIFDLFVPDPIMIALGIKRNLDFEGEYEPGKKIRRYTSMKADAVRQVSSVFMEIEWEENNELKSESWQFDMRYFYLWELEHLLARSKLKLEKICGDYNESDLNLDSKEFIVICSK